MEILAKAGWSAIFSPSVKTDGNEVFFVETHHMRLPQDKPPCKKGIIHNWKIVCRVGESNVICIRETQLCVSTKNLVMQSPKSRLFHISEQPGISIFTPRPSPSHFENITGDVVFAISDQLLHNYLLPRDCPRVTFYAGADTTDTDKQKFTGNATANHVVAVESGWYQQIKETTLYCYEFLPDDFMLIDECAGYYISYKPVVPITVTVIDDIMAALLSRDVELRFMPLLTDIAHAVRYSSLQFSLIRMRNAKG